ncbi:MAG TPA: F0F1 ATP synthase subunit A, partial [Gemmatimonadales bacterium]|nr:F0F1 ATP synthase subunit A [Gemmatimonadales bacterium]
MMLQEVNVKELIFHHTADAWEVWGWHLPRFADIHIGALTLNLSPTKHVVFMLLAAFLVFLTMKIAGNQLAKQRAGEKAPKGFANAVEGLVLFVRNDIAIANIGHDGARFAPLIITLFFFILYCNFLGLLPFMATPTGNVAVTGGLALMVFAIIEVGGMVKLGFKGYMRTIFPHMPGLHGAAGTFMSIAMAPIEILSKLVKPFALAVRLFGNMTAGHFVILSLFAIVFIFGHLGLWSWGIGLASAAMVLGVM